MNINPILAFSFLADPGLSRICRKYEIQPKMSKHLLKLRGFEIVIVCDDSSSMNNPTENPGRTRWDELCSTVKIIVEIGVIFDSDGVDIYFLNRDPILKVKDSTNIVQAFQTPPEGHTPLALVLKEIFQSELASRKRNKKLFVLVATDGEPTDENGVPNRGELKRIMEKVRTVATTHVSFLICTEDRDGVAYLDQWDKSMRNVDINDDFKTQREKIRQRRRRKDYPFSRGDYVVKVMMGAIVPELDRLDECD